VVAENRTVVTEDAFENRQHAHHVRPFLKVGKVALTPRVTLDLVQQTSTLVVHEAVAVDAARAAAEIVVVAATSLQRSRQVRCDAKDITKPTANAQEKQGRQVRHVVMRLVTSASMRLHNNILAAPNNTLIYRPSTVGVCLSRASISCCLSQK